MERYAIRLSPVIHANHYLKEKRVRPFAHRAIASVIESVAFSNKEGPARLFNGSLKPIPLATLAFAAVTVRRKRYYINLLSL